MATQPTNSELPAAPASSASADDEVDKIVSAWQREHPGLDVAPLHVLSRVGRLARLLNLARKDAFASHDLDTPGFDVLTALRRAGDPYQLTPGQLVAETLVSSGTMTNRIDRLERSGDVARHPDPNDRRGTLVQLTAHGKERVDSTMLDLLSRERELLGVLSDTERDTLGSLLRRVLQAIESDG